MDDVPCARYSHSESIIVLITQIMLFLLVSFQVIISREGKVAAGTRKMQTSNGRSESQQTEIVHIIA